MSSKVKIEFRNHAFSRRMQTFAVVNRDHKDVSEFLNDAYHFFEIEVKKLLTNNITVKLNTCFNATFEKIITPHIRDNENRMEVDDEDENRMEVDIDESDVQREPRTEEQTLYIHSKSTAIDEQTDLRKFYEDIVMVTILRKIDDAILLGSGFKLKSINELLVQVNRLDPLRGSSYLVLPKELRSKKAIINVKNNDEMCFKWAVLSALHKVPQNAERMTNYIQFKDELNFNGIEFPVKIGQISKFEQMNPSISINVYIYNEDVKKVQPLRLTNSVKEHHIHLLLLTGTTFHYGRDVTTDVKYHYCWIKNFSRLLSKQISNHNGVLFFCDRCLNHFLKKPLLEAHVAYCKRQNECEIRMPDETKDKVKFKNVKNQLESPFVIYADVEAILKTPTKEFCKSETTVAYQQHEVYSVGYYLHCSYDETKSYYKAKRGPTCIDWFVQELYELAFCFNEIFTKIVPMEMTPEDIANHEQAKTCHICDEEFNATDNSERSLAYYWKISRSFASELQFTISGKSCSTSCVS